MTELTKEQIEELNDWVDKIEIDESDLESARWDCNIYGVEPQYAVGGWIYDEDEYYKAQIDKAIDYLKSDGWGGYFEYADNQDDEALTKEAIEYLEKKNEED